MSQVRQGRPRSRTPPETAEAVWCRRWQAASRRLDEVSYLVATAESLPANTEANLAAKLAALVSLWQHRAEALHVFKMLEAEGRPWEPPPSLGTQTRASSDRGRRAKGPSSWRGPSSSSSRGMCGNFSSGLLPNHSRPPS